MILTFTTPEYQWLSNMWECDVPFHSMVTFRSVEHGYQSLKTFDVDEFMWVMNAPTPKQSKGRGRRVNMRPDWNEVKDQIMYELVLSKFVNNAELANKLLATEEMHLEEGNYWKDRYWGVYPIGSGEGQNKLGKILMRVRHELRIESHLFQF